MKLPRRQIVGGVLLALFALIFIFARARHLLFR